MNGFRDPAGRLRVLDDGRLLRVITDPRAAAEIAAFLAIPLAAAEMRAGRIARTTMPTDAAARALGEDGSGTLLLEHQRVEFPSYPYEWAPAMLHAAARLTLDLATATLDDGFGLKDATPYNVLFDGARPVFVDLASFERRDPGDPVWRAQAQFVRTFLLPLLAAQRLGVSLVRSLAPSREGLTPEEVYRMAGPWRRLARPFLGLATAPTWLGARSPAPGLYVERRLEDPAQARFVLGALYRQAARSLDRVRPAAAKPSGWSSYDRGAAGDDGTAGAKHRFVEQALAEQGPARVLDLGCNTGRHAVLAARSGARVVAVDADPDVVGTLWTLAFEQGLGILPLVIDLARPSPAIGWRNVECASFLDRARGRFEMVLVLALVHHLLVAERVPLDEIIGLIAELSTRRAIVEWVAPDDPRFVELTRGRAALHAGLDRAAFEAACRARFTIVRSGPSSAKTRLLYLLEKRHDVAP